MRVLFIGFVWPEPKSSAAGQNILSYIKAFVERGDDVSFCSAADTTEQSAPLSEMGVVTFKAQLNCSSFDAKIEVLAPEIVIFDRFLCFEQFAWRVKQACPQATQVLDAEDLHFLRKARHDMLKKTSELFVESSEISKLQNRSTLLNDIALRELACIYQADVTLVLSHFEYELLIEVFNVPHHQVAHTPFILDHIPAPKNLNCDFESRADFVFIGNFRHAPNFHSAKILRENIWPLIAKQLKKQNIDAKCHVYGAYLSPKAKQLENKALGFLVHGFADDQFTVIHNARVMLAPISFGAGVKGKLLDAMLCNTPSVTTNIGAEGITKQIWPGSIASNIEEFVSAAICLYTTKETWLQSAKQGASILSQEYTASKNRQHLIQTVLTAQKDMSKNRAINTMQQLLSHHQYQTNRYMSQWIEAKNK